MTRLPDDFLRDWYRYFGDTRPSIREVWRERDQLVFLWRFRRAQNARGRFASAWTGVLLSRTSRRTLLQIPRNTCVGAGLRLGHAGPLVVSSLAVIGPNCNLASGVTIGATQRASTRGAPTLLGRVWVGTNAVIVGSVTIGENVLIAPNSFVNMDVPDNSVVVGNPASIHARIDATSGYVENIC